MGKCGTSIATVAECRSAAAARLAALEMGNLHNLTVRTGSDPAMPAGCSITVPRPAIPGGRPTTATAFLNTATGETAAACGGRPNGQLAMWGAVKGNTPAQEVGVWVSANATHLEITMAGPSSVWFGVGVNASVMAAKPWTIVVDGEGTVSEHKLGDHTAGTALPPTVTVISSKTANGRRVVKAVRPITAGQFDFDSLLQKGELPLITAVGSGSKFGKIYISGPGCASR